MLGVDERRGGPAFFPGLLGKEFASHDELTDLDL
jgi:hypothetical protein